MGGGVSNIGLGFNFSSRDMASGPINLLRGNFNQLHRSVRMGVPQIAASLGVLAGSLAVAFAGAAGIRGAFNLAESASVFGRSIADVGNVSQATAGELRQLEDTAIRAGVATQFSPAAAAEGLGNLASNGQTAREAMETLIPVLNLAAASGIEVSAAADIVASSLNAAGYQADQAGLVTDRLVRATQLSALRAGEFEGVMGRALSTGQMFNQSMDSTVIALGSMRSAGIPATVAVTSYGEAARRVFTDESAQQAVRRLGVEVTDSQGRFRDLAEIMNEMSGAMGGMTESARQQIVTEVFQVQGMQAFNAVAQRQATIVEDGRTTTLRGAEAIAYYTRELENSSGTAAAAAEARLRTFWGAMELLVGTVQTVATVFGQTFGQVFRPMVSVLTSSLNILTTTWRSFSDGMQRAIATGFLVASALAVVMGVAGAVGVALVLVIGTLGSLLGTAVAVGAGVALAMLPITAAIAAVMAAGYALYRSWQDNLGGLRDFTTRWVGTIGRLWEGLRRIFVGRRSAVGVMMDMNERGETSMANLLGSIERLYHRGSELWRAFATAFTREWERVGPQLEQLRGSFDRLLEQTGRSAVALAGVAEGADQDSLASFGATLATVIVQGFIDIAYFAVVVTEAITGVMALFDSPTWQLFADTLGLIAAVMGQIYDIYNLMAGIGETVNPLNWLTAGAQLLSGQDVTAIPALNSGERIGVSDRLAAFTGTQRPAESGTDRPAASGGTPRGITRDEMDQIIERRSSGGRPVNLNNRIQVNVDGRQLADAESRNRIEQNTLSGDLYAGEQSVWTD